MALHRIFESFQHVLCPWIANILSVGHEIVEAFVSGLDVISGGSFNNSGMISPIVCWDNNMPKASDSLQPDMGWSELIISTFMVFSLAYAHFQTF